MKKSSAKEIDTIANFFPFINAFTDESVVHVAYILRLWGNLNTKYIDCLDRTRHNPQNGKRFVLVIQVA